MRTHVSSDGQEWSWVGTVEHECTGQFFLGLAVASHDDTQVSRARFSGVKVSAMPAAPVNTATSGSGDGLLGTYFSTMDQSGPGVTRVDPVVEFDWSQQTPVSGVGPYRFSVRWDGELDAQYSEPYALQVVSDDRARVWLDGKLLIDEWREHAESQSSAVVNLQAGKRYPLRVDYFQNRGRATVRLLWSSPSTACQIIPQSQLHSRLSVVAPDTLEQTYQSQLLPPLTAAGNLGCPQGWLTMDVGCVGVEGSVQVSDGVWTVSGAGADIWANEDSFRFVFQPWDGDGEFTTRVLSQADTDPWARAGLMIRDGLRSDARQAMLALTAEKGISFAHRSVPAVETQADDGGPASPGVWLRLVRSGSQIAAFSSQDGAAWQWIGTEGLNMSAQVLVGLAVSSHDNSALGTAVFDQVGLQPVVGGPRPEPAAGSGTGLNASYFDGATGNVVTRIDPQVNFDWDLGSPTSGVGPENFSARWTGWLQAQFDGPYSLHIISDDGARLWLDDQLLVDAWYDRAAVQTSAMVTFQAGGMHSLRLEYYQRSREALVKLLWSSPSTPKQPIPQSQLYAALSQPDTLTSAAGAATSGQGQKATAVDGGVVSGEATAPAINSASSTAAVTALVTVLDIPASEAVAKLGRWENDRAGLYAVDRRGWVEYALMVPSAGVFGIEVEGASHNPTDIDPGFDLSLILDGEVLGNLLLDAPPKLTGKVQAETPFIKPGLHMLRVVWDNARKGRSLHLLRVRLQGPGGTGPAAVALAAARVRARNEIVTSGSGATNLSSPTSPLCLEGRGRYLSMMRIHAGGGDVVPQPGVDGRWYADVPLAEGKPVQVEVGYENGGLIEKRSLEWQPTDLLHCGDVAVRQGDALLLTFGAERRQGRVQIEGVTNYIIPEGGVVCHRFEKSGTFSIVGACGGAQAAEARPPVKVRVLGANAGTIVAAWVGKQRTFPCPGLDGGIVLDADPCVSIQTTDDGQRAISISVAERRQILARLATGGPILARIPVDGFRVYSAQETNFEVIKTYPDGTDLIEMGVVSDPVLPEVGLRIAVAVGGVVFDDGTVVKNLTARDFDPLGQYTVHFLRPGSSKTSACHTLKAYQAGAFIGQH